MSVEATREVIHSRPEPAEWTALVDLAQSELLASGEEAVTRPVAEAMLEAAAEIDDEPLEAARYYGLGLVVCGLARALNQPEIRQRAVSHAAKNIASGWWELRGSFDTEGLRIDDIVYPVLFVFDRIAQRASDSLPAPAHLTADVLSCEANRRDVRLMLGCAPDDPRAAQSREIYITKVRAGDPTAQAVSRNVVAGSMSVLQEVLKSKHAHDNPPGKGAAAKPPASWEDSPTVTEAAGAGGLKGLDWGVVAQRCAALRQDEFITGITSYVDIGPDDKAVFRSDRVVPSRKLGPAGVFGVPSDRVVMLHRKRLRCPALFVEGLIPLVVDMTNDIVTGAQREVASQMAIRDKQRSYHY